MILRVVKMEFNEGDLDTFLGIFGKYSDQIRAAEGVHEVQLKQDIKDPCICFTLSHWESEAFLNQYRDSALFNEVWGQVKPLFRAKAQAWSITDPATK